MPKKITILFQLVCFYLNQIDAGDDVLDLADQLCLGSSIEFLELDAELGLLGNLLLLFRKHERGTHES
jgi:hypothetical protein